MAGTRASLETLIADDLVDAPVTAAQITAAVDDAIEAMSATRFKFNEAAAVSVTFSSSVDTVAMSALPVYFTKIDRLRIRVSTNTQDLQDLTPRDYSWLMDGQDVKTLARPIEYCIYADAIQFDSRLDQNYTGVVDGIKRLSPGSTNSYSTSSSVSWFTEGKNVIRYRAERDLLANVVRDDGEAQKKQLLLDDELRTQRQKINARNSGRVRPTSW